MTRSYLRSKQFQSGRLTPLEAERLRRDLALPSYSINAVLTEVSQNVTVTLPVDLDELAADVAAVTNAVVLKGVWDASAGTFPAGDNTGWSYIVSVGGMVDGVAFTAQDRIVAIVDAASSTTYAGNWHKLDYTDQVSSVAGRTGAVVLAEADITDLQSYLLPADIGSTVQGYDADLAAIGALAKTDGNFIVGNGTAWVAESGATARTSLGLGTGDSPQFSGLNVSAAIAMSGGSSAGISAATSDGSDSSLISLCGGGSATSNPRARGAFITLYGNEHATRPADLVIHAGNAASTGSVSVNVGGTVEALRADRSGCVLIGGSTPPASATRALALFNGTAPTGGVTNGVVLYSEDVAASAELRVRDESGSITTLSPHNFSGIPEGPSEDMAWSYYSQRDGKAINVDMLRAMRLLEKLSGEKLVYESHVQGDYKVVTPS